MSYLALTFPSCISLGAMRSDDWSTSVNRTFGGWSQRNSNRSRVLHSWDLSFAVRSASDYQAIVKHFHEARGQAHSFPFYDHLDHFCAQADGVLTLVSGSIYQAYKRYGSTNAFDRKITRPVATMTVYRTRAAVTTTISPTIDYTTGQVTVSGHVDGDTYAWSGEFVVPCRYATDRLPGAIINRQPGAGGEHLVSCDPIVIEEDFE